MCIHLFIYIYIYMRVGVWAQGLVVVCREFRYISILSFCMLKYGCIYTHQASAGVVEFCGRIGSSIVVRDLNGFPSSVTAIPCRRKLKKNRIDQEAATHLVKQTYSYNNKQSLPSEADRSET